MTVTRAVIWCAVSSEEQAASDKDSLPKQERDARELCEREGWQIVAVLLVPGHSRAYDDFYEMAYDMRQAGIDAADRLFELWQRNGFDVLIVRDEKRFAREQSIHAYIIKKTINAGARIFAFNGGWIDKSNYRERIALGGLSVARDIDELNEKRRFGMEARVKNGLSSHHLPLGFRLLLKDGTARTPEKLVHDPEARQLIDDMAVILLDGVGWERFGAELYRRFGHVNPRSKKPYTIRAAYGFFHNPYTWGHTAYRYTGKHGVWAFDESEPLPDGVVIHRGKHDPLYTGRIADEIKAELHRRDNTRGRWFTNKAYCFTGLLLCASCGQVLSIHHVEHYYRNGVKRPLHTPYTAWFCNRARRDRTCPQHHGMSDGRARVYMNDLLRQIQERRSLDILRGTNTPPLGESVDKYRRDIATLQKQIERLIDDQSKAPANTHDLYTAKIQAAAARLEILQGSLARLTLRQSELDRSRLQERAFSDLCDIKLSDFWALPPREINRRLRALFGSTRLVVEAGQIVGLTR